MQYQKVILYKQEAAKHDHYLIFRTALWTWMYFPSTRNFRSEVSGLSNSFFRDSATVKKSSCSTILKQTNKQKNPMLSILKGWCTSLTKASSSTKSMPRKIGQYQGSIGLSSEMGRINPIPFPLGKDCFTAATGAVPAVPTPAHCTEVAQHQGRYLEKFLRILCLGTTHKVASLLAAQC